MTRPTKEKLWTISVVDGKAKVLRNSMPLKSRNEQEYGILLDIDTEVSYQSGKEMIQVRTELLAFNCLLMG